MTEGGRWKPSQTSLWLAGGLSTKVLDLRELASGQRVRDLRWLRKLRIVRFLPDHQNLQKVSLE